jgi:regulator of protease activity HflC (stomatin/prohibitin superfamily)
MSENPPSLLAHSHAHEPDPAPGSTGAAGAATSTTDPAQQALADALRVTFAILKLVMLVLGVLYLCSGIFSIKANERAVRLRFGHIVGEPGHQVLGPGSHVGLPFPLEQEKLELSREFWFRIPPGQEDRPVAEMVGGALDPEQDGSMITGDGSIVHSRWLVSYNLGLPAEQDKGAAGADKAVLNYLRNVKDEDRAEQLVRYAAEQGAVFAVAQVSADAVFRGEVNDKLATARAQEVLDAQDTGITVTKQEFLIPLSVRSAFQEVSNAQNNARRRVDEARSKSAQTLIQTAGPGAEALLELIDQYDQAQRQGNVKRLEELDAILKDAFESPQAEGRIALHMGGQTHEITGAAAAAITKARSLKSAVLKQASVDRVIFDHWKDQYAKNPSLVLSRLWQQAREEILSGDVEKFVIPDGEQPWILINRDPAIRRANMQNELEAAQHPKPPGTP